LSVAGAKKIVRHDASDWLLYAENKLFNPTLSENACAHCRLTTLLVTKPSTNIDKEFWKRLFKLQGGV
jgi:hypothetical protein